MKKCTNSACRRMFNPAAINELACPHCGKVYPRVIGGHNVWVIHGRRYCITEVLMYIRKGKKFHEIMALREKIVGHDKLSMREAKDLVEAHWVALR